MSRIIHLDNGSTIKADVVQSFDLSVANPDNNFADGSINWNFVEADMHLDCGYYAASYIAECFDKLADEYDLDIAYDRLQVLKTDYLGMEA